MQGQGNTMNKEALIIFVHASKFRFAKQQPFFFSSESRIQTWVIKPSSYDNINFLLFNFPKKSLQKVQNYHRLFPLFSFSSYQACNSYCSDRKTGSTYIWSRFYSLKCLLAIGRDTEFPMVIGARRLLVCPCCIFSALVVISYICCIIETICVILIILIFFRITCYPLISSSSSSSSSS